jgi:hypothetical protein
MKRLLNVFLLIESTAGTSLLSIYSTSGLLKESHVDMVSSKETESPSDLLGETSMLHGAGMAAVLGTVSSLLLGKDVTLLQGTSALDLTLEDAAKFLPENPIIPVLAGGPFFAMETLVADDTFNL